MEVLQRRTTDDRGGANHEDQTTHWARAIPLDDRHSPSGCCGRHGIGANLGDYPSPRKCPLEQDPPTPVGRPNPPGDIPTPNDRCAKRGIDGSRGDIRTAARKQIALRKPSTSASLRQSKATI